MDVGNRPVLYGLNERTRAAVTASADENQFCAFTHIDAGVFVTVMNHTLAGRFDPTAKASDAMTDVGLWFYNFVGAFYGKMKIFDVSDD